MSTSRIKRQPCGYYEDDMQLRAAFVGSMSIIEATGYIPADDSDESLLQHAIKTWEKAMENDERARFKAFCKRCGISYPLLLYDYKCLKKNEQR